MPLLPRPLLALLAVLGLVLGMAGAGGARACDAAGERAAAHGPHAAMAPAGDGAPDCHRAPDGVPCAAGWHCPTAAAPAPGTPAAAPTVAPAGARHAVRATFVPGPVAELEPPPPRA